MKLHTHIKAGRQHLYLNDKDGNLVATTDASLLFDEVYISGTNDSYTTFRRNRIIRLEENALPKWLNLGCPSTFEIDDSGFVYPTFIIIEGNSLTIRQFKNKEEGVVFCQNYLDQSKEIIIREIVSIDNIG